MSFIADAFGLAAPQAAIVTKVVEVVAVLGLAGSVVLYLEHRGAAGELAKLQKSSTKLIDQANKDIARETAQHQADNTANQGMLDATLKANALLSDTLDQRVRDAAAYRASHPDVPRAGGGPAAACQGEPGAAGSGDITLLLAERGNDLYRSAGELAATLSACQRDRDSLTGAPK